MNWIAQLIAACSLEKEKVDDLLHSGKRTVLDIEYLVVGRRSTGSTSINITKIITSGGSRGAKEPPFLPGCFLI